MKIFIIIPSYNEQENISLVLEKLKEKYENIVVIDDGSSDRTSEISDAKGVETIRHVINRGQGAAIQTGHDYALKHDADIIVHFDSDGQMRVEDIEKVIEPIKNREADVVLGSRFLENSTNMPLSKRFFIIKPAIYLNWLFSGLKLTDAHNGFRAISRSAAELIGLEQDKMAHATEILEQIKKYGIKFKEVPVRINYTEYGQGFRGGVKILRDLLVGKLIK